MSEWPRSTAKSVVNPNEPAIGQYQKQVGGHRRSVDLIVHDRYGPNGNFAAFEFKRADVGARRSGDITKIVQLVSNPIPGTVAAGGAIAGYRIGAAIVLQRFGWAEVRWYKQVPLQGGRTVAGAMTGQNHCRQASASRGQVADNDCEVWTVGQPLPQWNSIALQLQDTIF